MRYFLVLIIVVLFSTPASAANSSCAVSQQMRYALAKEYREAVTIRLLTHDGNVIEVWRNAGNTSWSLASTTPRGITCVFQSGTMVENVIWHLKELSDDL